MTTNTSKSIPFIVLAIVVGTLALETVYDIEINIEEVIPILTAMGVAGVPLAVAKKAFEARKAIPTSIEDRIKEEIDKKLKGS